MSATAKNQLQDTNNDYGGVYPERSRRDAAGNLIQPGPIGGPYVFDAENHLISAGGMAYLYDGRGSGFVLTNPEIRMAKRVGKAPASTPTQPNYLYWYGTGSDPLEETDGVGNYLYRDFRFNGMLLARGEDDWVDHFFLDALGNARCVYGDGDPDGGCSDYYPFGGERPISYGGVNVPFKFTGKERDPESGLDNFDVRYFGSSMGRFMSPDPDNAGARLEAPQSWNAYSYVLNNPLNYIDPFGLDCVYLNEGGDKVQEVKSGDCRSETDNGYYVNGTIQGGINGVALTPDNNTIVYSYTNEDQPGTQYGHQCVGDCSGPDYTVTVSAAPPGTPTMSAAPLPGTLQPPIFPRQPTTFWQRLNVVAGCMAGLDPELMQPMNLQPEAPTSPPNDSTKESEGQKRAQVLGPDGRPLQYRNGRPVSPNPQGARNAETVTAAAGGVAAAANASQCIGNAAKQ